MIVYLTAGYEVELEDEDGLHHLFGAVFGEVLTGLRETDSMENWGQVHDTCICELHYVAGQLRSAGSSLDIVFLLDHFMVHWDMMAERLKSM